MYNLNKSELLDYLYKTYPKDHEFNIDQCNYIIHKLFGDKNDSFVKKLMLNKNLDNRIENKLLNLLTYSKINMAKCDNFLALFEIFDLNKDKYKFINVNITKKLLDLSTYGWVKRNNIKYLFDVNNYLSERLANMETDKDKMFDLMINRINGVVIDFLNNNPNYIVSSWDFANITLNTKLSWEHAEKLYYLFKTRGFYPEINCFQKMSQLTLVHKKLNIFKMIVTDLYNLDKNNFDKMLCMIDKNKPRSLNIFLDVISQIEPNYTISLKSMNYILEMGCLNGYHEIVNIFYKKMREEPTMETLELACTNCYVYIALDLIDKLEPDQKCMEKAWLCPNISIINKLYNNKLYTNYQCFKNFIDYCNKSKLYIYNNKVFSDYLNLMVYCGFNIDESCLMHAKHHSLNLTFFDSFIRKFGLNVESVA